MSSGSYRMVNVRCPFFRRFEDRQKTIVCEGILADESTINLKYLRGTDFDIQAETFCCGRYQCCEVYRMLMDAKFPEEET